MPAYNRDDYATKFKQDELKRMYLNALDRSERANTMEASLTDMYQMQEIAAACEINGWNHPYVEKVRFARVAL